MRLPVAAETAIPLGRPSPGASCDRPERRRGDPPGVTNPGFGPSRRRLPLLLGLAPGGVFHAVAVAGGAVRSYRTVSPLPPARLARASSAVCFLWHFPWGRPRRALPGTVPPWSPDFPLPALRRAAVQPSGGRDLSDRGAFVKGDCRRAAAPQRKKRCSRRRRHADRRGKFFFYVAAEQRIDQLRRGPGDGIDRRRTGHVG